MHCQVALDILDNQFMKPINVQREMINRVNAGPSYQNTSLKKEIDLLTNIDQNVSMILR